jgi:hypothetical protein
VLAQQGVAGLYSGVQAAILGSIISSSIYFGTYEMGKGIFSSIINCPKILIPPLAAAVGNITSSAILVPKEVIKQRMQAGMVGSASEVFIQTIQTEGVGGLYAGYSAALLRNLPSNIISFSTFVSNILVSVHISVVHTLHGDHEDFYLFWFCVVLELCHSLPLAVPSQIGCMIPDYVKF